jgi:hypothetical protein
MTSRNDLKFLDRHDDCAPPNHIDHREVIGL